MPIYNAIMQASAEMREWRHYLHAHPELGFEEHNTARFVAEKLKEFGIEVHQGFAGTGVVGVIRGKGNSKRMIGLRADMDALPIVEASTHNHKSKKDGVMHACGHDGHTAMLLGAARYLAETRNFDGAVVLIFQPAEEGGGGGKVMLDEGLFDKFPVESVWGMHNWPGLDVGRVGIHHGAAMAAADVFDIRIEGRGGHAAMPHETADPIIAAGALIQGLQSVVSRRVNPLDAAVVSITQCHSGFTHNVIPSAATLQGSVRYFNTEIGKEIHQTIAEMASEIAKAHRCKAECEWEIGYPPTTNDSEAATRAANTAAEVLGAGCVTMNPPPSMAAEDFAYMLKARPGAYIWLGAGHPKANATLHNPNYDFNDELLPLGASYWAALTERELALE